MNAIQQLELASEDGRVLTTEPSSAPLAVRNLTVSYNEKPVVLSMDFEVPAGTMVAVIGPNGAGKSTLIKAALGALPRLAGTVTAFGQSLEQSRHRIAYVPQRASVDWDFPARVFDVVLMGMSRELGLLRPVLAAHRTRVLDCLDRVGMEDFAMRQIGQLSGGQQQRVFLARALAQNADLYLLDEPLAGVDAATESAVIDVLKTLKSEGRTVVCVHHDLSTVPDYFDHVLLMNIRKIAAGPVATTFTAENLQAAYGGRLASTQLDQLQVPAA